MDLSPPEIRVLGCLLEKQRTTPEAYPLSLNALRLACNQSTNRDPVVDYDEATIREALHRLSRRRWARLASGPGSRAPKYRHLLDEALALPDDELAVLCVLMLRGPQTPGELKQRTERLHPLADLAAVHAALGRLIERELAARLERRPGQKEERYTQLLGEDAVEVAPAAVTAASVAPAPVAAPAPPLADDAPHAAPAPDPRIDRLEDEIATLRADVAALRASLDALRAELGA
ncbi:MAG TPA: YceH family protein [Solirubrobacteraceae bacterium]